MSDRKLRWGLLSTARINRALIPPLRMSSRNELLAVASRTQERAEAYAQEWHIPKAYGSYEALLADPEIDVVYVPLPNSMHEHWTIEAAKAGKHVLCEKPLAISVAEVDAIRAAAERAGVVVAEAFMYRHHPQTLQVKALVDAGAIGTVRLVRGSFSFSLNREGDVRLDPALGGGALWDVGCYPVSYARYILGKEPIEVFGRKVVGSSGVDETFTGHLRFPGEVYAQIDCSFRATFRTHIEIVGSDGAISVPRPFKPGLQEHILITRGDEVERIPVQGQELYLGEVEDMADAVLLGKPPRVSLADSRANVAALVALLESSEKGQPVRVA
ncbi:MAG: Gfo/Idh/MocA family oxidoreductase [Anaerolineae bacterium]|nr:Gfo/Idh/MocA family oxidoreductase [Thermoflexales bacterium]MDW8407186.1 Gfo/Idh/MocA family oxidoreductase [Anaerolineae bacterium]